MKHSGRVDNVLNMTEGNPLSLLARFSVPMLIGNIFQQVYNFADSIIVGQLLGADSLAAVGMSSAVTFLFIALCNGIGSGGGIVCAQYFGADESGRVKTCITNTAYIMFGLSIIIGAIAYILAIPMLNVLNTPANIFDETLDYVRVMCVGVIFVAIYNYGSSMLRALGDAITPLYFLIVSCVINVVLDFYFVKSLELGVFGAAVATVIAQLLAGVGCLVYAAFSNEYFKLKREDMIFNKDISYQVIRIGVPLSLQYSMIAISCMALQRVVNAFGSVAVAAYTATQKVDNLLYQPYQTLGNALSTYTGQNYGAKKESRILEGYRDGIIIMLVFSALMLVIMQFLGDNIIALFVSEADVIAMGGTALRISSMFYAMLGLIYVVRGVLSGLGDAFFALLNGIVEVIGRFTVPFILTAIPLFGVWGIWWSVGIVWLISAVAAWIRYIQYKGKML